VLGGVDGSLHFTVPSMNRLNQTEPATFSILPCWAFFRDSVFICFISFNDRVRISLGEDSFYLHCLVYMNMVGLRARFGAPLTGLNSPAVIFMLLTVPRRRPSMFLRCMSMLFHTAMLTLLLVSLVVFSSTVNIFPIASSFYFLN
jgi:hypothetical protein